jgi:hypothetical protein
MSLFYLIAIFLLVSDAVMANRLSSIHSENSSLDEFIREEAKEVLRGLE